MTLLHWPWLHTFALILALASASAQAAEPSYDCDGKARFVHRGAPSTVPAAEKRSYRFADGQLDGLACKITDADIGCYGLTPQQAYRRVVIDRLANTVSDTMELPTSMLIFEGSCR